MLPTAIPASGSADGVLARWKRRLRPRTRLTSALRLAARTRLGWRPLVNLATDLRYGGYCGGTVSNPFAESGASRVQSTDYAALARVHRRNAIDLRPTDVLVDVGCGKGRVINWWLSRGLRNPIVGLELLPAVAEAAARRLRRHPNVRIVPGDAIANLPADGTFFYLYNPFDERRMEAFADALARRAARPRDLRVLYFNCRHLDVFLRDPRWRVRPLDTGEPEPAALITLSV